VATSPTFTRRCPLERLVKGSVRLTLITEVLDRDVGMHRVDEAGEDVVIGKRGPGRDLGQGYS
jgi:hypothetical protein